MSRTLAVFACLFLACGAATAAGQPPTFKSNILSHAPRTVGMQKRGGGTQRGAMVQHSSSSAFNSAYGGLTTLNHSPQRHGLYSSHSLYSSYPK